MFRKKILSTVSAAALLGVASSAMAIPLVPDGDFESVFFKDSEVWIDTNDDNILNTGDVLWGVADLNQIINSGTDETGQTGFSIWPIVGASLVPPPEVSAYFAIVVKDTIAPGDAGALPGATGNTLIFAPTTDPNGILASGDVFALYEDTTKNFNDTTQGSALSTATDGTQLGTFAMPDPSDTTNSGDTYWYSDTPNTPLEDGSTGESWVGLVEGSNPFSWDFGDVNDPNESYSSGAGVAGGLTVDFFFNVELLVLSEGLATGFAIGDDQPMHIGSNDPGVFAPLRVPEPTILALMGIGMLGMGLARRRRNV